MFSILSENNQAATQTVAAKIQTLHGRSGEQVLANVLSNSWTEFEVCNKVSSWATSYVKEVLSAHAFNGNTATTITPKSNLTYAEAAQAIKNLLVESKLINK